MATLSDDQIEKGLVDLPGWSRAGDEIEKTYELPSFPDAVAFVTRVGFLAEAANHHPDLDVRYSKVRVGLSTHSEGGITENDLSLAGEIEAASAGRSKG